MLDFIQALWQRSSALGRTGLIIGALVALSLPVGLFWWAGKPDYQVLFADMDAKDAAAVVAALDKQKTPYVLADEGRTIQVEEARLYQTRMNLLSSGLDLKGHVGFELFNNAEFGMTEFAQKVNYLRAMQGELARTIMGFDEVQNARVHLALPESGMLRKRGTKAKASVWVTLKGGQQLSQEQVNGIQRLIAASVPELDSGAVTVLDHRGVALSMRERAENGMASGDANLQLKKETEQYLARKVSHVLDAALGPDQAAVSVDVVLDLASVKTTRESLLGADADKGVLVRKREQWQGEGETESEEESDTEEVGYLTQKKIEADYQVGREIQQIELSPGAIKAISVGVVTHSPLSDQTVERLRSVIGKSIGLNTERGDDVAFSVIHNAAANPSAPAAKPAARPSSNPKSAGMPDLVWWLLGVAALLVIILLGWGWSASRRRQAEQPLTASEREQLLIQVRRWLAHTPASQERQP